MPDSPGEKRRNTSVLPAAESSKARPTHAATASATSVRGDLKHSCRVGLSGGGATVLSVTTTMWLHTIITYQQRHGTKFAETARHLWKDGGPRRFYRGYLPSLAVAPICRFGDTLSNELAMTLLQRDPDGIQSRGVGNGNGRGRTGDGAVYHELPLWLSTLVGSLGAAAFHAAVVPLDTYKTVMQVAGNRGMQILEERVRRRGFVAVYDGAMGFAGGSLMGHYPWYLTYNILERRMPQPMADDGKARRRRSAIVGTGASIVSAASSNSLRVLKVYRQSHHLPDGVTYLQAIAQIVKKDGGGARGAMGVFGRGLAGRTTGSAIQGLVFNVIWKEICHWSGE